MNPFPPHQAKSRGGKLQKVQMTVSSKVVKLEDIQKQVSGCMTRISCCVCLAIDIVLSCKRSMRCIVGLHFNLRT